MKVVSVYELRDNLATYLDSVAVAETPIVVNRFGKPIAMITPYRKDRGTPNASFFGFMGSGETGEAFLARVRRSNKERRAIARFRNPS